MTTLFLKRLRCTCCLIALGTVFANLSACSSNDADPNAPIVSIPSTPESELLQKAMSTYDQQLYSASRELWEKLRNEYPATYYAVLAELKIGDSYFYAGDYLAARTVYEEFRRAHPSHEAVPYVSFQIGKCYKNSYQGTLNDQNPLLLAISAFQEVIQKFPNNRYAALAANEILQARDEFATHEAEVALFYIKRDLIDAAANRYLALFQNYGETEPAKSFLARAETEYPEKFALLQEAISKRSGQVTNDKTSPYSQFKMTEARGNTQRTLTLPEDLKMELAGLRQPASASINRQKQAAEHTSDAPTSESTDSKTLFIQPTLHCEKIGAAVLFVATFPYPVHFETDSNSSNQKLSGRLNLVASDSDSTAEIQEQSCHVESSSLIVEELQGATELQKNVRKVAYSLQTTHQKVSTFLLDRPYRLVFILHL